MSFLGIDFGTDSVRALIVDGAGQTLAEAVRPYPRWGEGRYIDAAAGMFRQHPLDYIESMTAAVREAVSHVDASEVKGIGVDTTGSTPCLTDASGAWSVLAHVTDNHRRLVRVPVGSQVSAVRLVPERLWGDGSVCRIFAFDCR